MNVFVKELKLGIKVFLIWVLVLFLFVFAGTVKYTGVEAGGEAMLSLLDSFPRIVLAVMGFANTNIGTFGGFYALLEVYVMIIVAIYSVHLGQSVVSRERIDKTYEFLFTKPRSRTAILGAKMAAATVFVGLFALLNLAFSQVAYGTLGLSEDMLVTFAYFSAEVFVVGMVFFGLGAMFSSLANRVEMGARIGNLSVLFCYFVGVVYDSVDNGAFLRPFSPFKYFEGAEVIDHRFDLVFLGLSVAILAVSLSVALWRFKKHDLAVS